jgi:hypothetical protein
VNINQLATFGDARRLILDTILELRSGSMDVGRGMAIAANMKVLNDSVQVEINAAKMALATEGHAHNFGRIVGMGQRFIGNDGSQEA